MTVGHRDLAKFLGKKNFKGIYSRNPLAATPAYAKFDRQTAYAPSWPVRREHKQGAKLTNWERVFERQNALAGRVPFKNNKFVKTNELIGEGLRRVILEGHRLGETTQQLSFRLGLSVPRVDAVIKLAAVRDQMTQKNEITKDMKTMAKHMRGLFDTIAENSQGAPVRRPDDLTEIPIPRAVQQQRFLSIAESEPFGPLDAAETLGIEPAATTLQKLSELQEEQEDAKHKKAVSFIAPQNRGDRSLLQVTDAQAGVVGFRYGAARDDRKHARRVTFLPNGNRVYPLPKSD